jgi:hypothetical protein
MALFWTIGHEWEKMGGEETWRPLFRNDVKAIAGWWLGTLSFFVHILGIIIPTD